jgi:glutaredoxin 3
MSNNVVWGQPNCKYCDVAKALLEKAGIPFEYKELETMDDKAEFFEVTNGARSVPQIIIDGAHIGGINELREMLA